MKAAEVPKIYLDKDIKYIETPTVEDEVE